MDGRYFAQRKLAAEFYDHVTNYHVEESAEARALRDKKWHEYLEQQSSSDEEGEGPSATYDLQYD